MLRIKAGQSANPMLGLFGGTFNPIHRGHLFLAERLLEALHLSAIHFIPSANPPLKTAPMVSAQHRAAMVELAITGYAKFSLDTRELSRSGHSYTIDTLTSLRAELSPQTSLCWLMGSDAFSRIDAWHRWQELLDYAHLIVVQRPHAPLFTTLPQRIQQFLQTHQADSINTLQQKPHGAILLQEIEALDISSTHIRQQLGQNQAVANLVSPRVLNYIKQHDLYGKR